MRTVKKSTFLKPSEVRERAINHPEMKIDVNTICLASQLNKVSGSNERDEQARIIYDCLRRIQKLDGSRRRMYIPMSAKDVMICFDGANEDNLPGYTFRDFDALKVSG